MRSIIAELMLVGYALALAMPVQLQKGTATFSQGPFGRGPYSPDMAIDGIFFTGTPVAPTVGRLIASLAISPQTKLRSDRQCRMSDRVL